MDSRLKQRLIGAAVLIALAVIFLPKLVNGPAPDSGVSDLALNVPGAPADAGTIELPLTEEVGDIPALDDGAAADSIAQTAITDAEAGADAAAPPTDTQAMLPANIASGQYVVHYATFATQPEADEMARQLQARTLPAFTRATTFNGRPAVSVRIGPYANRAEAETIRVRAAQVRADVSPLVLALDADDATPNQNAAASAGSGSGSAPAAATPSPSSAAPATPAAATTAARAGAAPATTTPPPRPAATVARPASAPASPPARQQASNTSRASAAPPAATGFVVQVGAFSNAASATRLQGRLRAANIPAFTDTVNTGRGRLTRVNAGPVASRSEADRLKTRVKSATGTEGIIRSYP